MKPIFDEELQFFKKYTGIELPTGCWRNGSRIYLDPTKESPIIVFKAKDSKLEIKKNLISTTDLTTQLTLDEVMDFYSERILELEIESINAIKEYMRVKGVEEKYVCSISGGKDSSVLLDLFRKATKDMDTDYKIEYNFANTSNETADTFKQVFYEIPKHTEGFNILNPKEGYYQWIERKNNFVPSVMVRNCCSVYKEGQVNKAYSQKEKTTMIVGVRKSESFKRSEYEMIMDYDFNMNMFGRSNFPETWTTFAPVLNWDDVHIWLYLLKNTLRFNKQYRYGFERCGCLWCPFQQDYIDLLIKEFYPIQFDRWMDVLSKNYVSTEVEFRLKWSLEEWQAGKWKQATSKEYEVMRKKKTPEVVKELADIKGISEELAEKYFDRTCHDCEKKLNSDEVALNLKMFGRGIDVSKMICGKCYQKDNGLNRKEYSNLVKGFRQQGCNLF